MSIDVFFLQASPNRPNRPLSPKGDGHLMSSPKVNESIAQENPVNLTIDHGTCMVWNIYVLCTYIYIYYVYVV